MNHKKRRLSSIRLTAKENDLVMMEAKGRYVELLFSGDDRLKTLMQKTQDHHTIWRVFLLGYRIGKYDGLHFDGENS